MSEASQEVAIDIGGGFGEYFVNRARESPEKTFLILDPIPLRLRRKPPNLYVVQWGSDESSTFPVGANSVDEANINFLWGEIRYQGEKNADKAEEFARERYRKLLADLQGVLKEGFLVRIADVQAHIGFIKDLLEEQGYLAAEPMPLQDVNRTSRSRYFASFAEMIGKGSGDFLRPMTIEARWKGK